MSVLFADLADFTTLGETRDAEDVREVLTWYFAKASDIVERFGGEVDKFIGDALTAFWGARVAHDDDAERAVRAALEMVTAVAEVGDEVGLPDLKLRVGVLSGETSVGSGGNRLGLVLGDIVNTASRLQVGAEPGTVVVGQPTRELTLGAIRYEELGDQRLKGKALPVRAWRALEVIAGQDGRGRSGMLEAHFVGRTNELRLLKDWLLATSQERRARLISIVGQAGIGKSRLATEFQHFGDGLAEVFRWHQGRSPAYGEGVTFWALGEMVRQRAGIAASDEGIRARNKLTHCLAERFADPDERRWIEPRLAGLLGLEPMPAGDRNELFSALRTFFQRLAESATTVMVFEDFHWADSGLLHFIEELVETSRNHPILVVTLARPDLLEKAPGWGTSRNSVSVHLAPMSTTDLDLLVNGLAPGLSSQTVDLIVHHAAGVPLYAIEYVRTMIASGDLVIDGEHFRLTSNIAELSLPDGLQAVIGARLDRLEPFDRAFVQDAAVLGQSFTLDGLTALTGMDHAELENKLHELSLKELIQLESDPRSPERGQFRFVQTAIREVAYGRLSKRSRRDRHLKVAGYFDELGMVEYATVIASHYTNAYQLGADEDVADRARSALLGAARRAATLHSHAQVISLCEQALSIPGDPRDHVAILELLVSSAGALFRLETAIDYGRRLLDHALEVNDHRATVVGARLLGQALLECERPGDAIALMAPHYVTNDLPGPEMRALGAALARAYIRNVDPEASAETAHSVMVAAERAEDTPLLVEVMNTYGTAISGLPGRVREGIALLREALRLSELIESAFSATRALNNLITTEWVDGLAAVRHAYERGLELAQRLGRIDLTARMAGGWRAVLIEDGRFQEALDLLRALDLGDEPFWTARKEGDIAALVWITTGAGEALEQALDSYGVLASSSDPQMVRWSSDARAETLLRLGRLEAALEEALFAGAKPLWQFRCFYVATDAAIRLKDPARIEQAKAMVDGAIGRRFEMIRKLADAGLAAVSGRPEEASRLFEQTCSEIERVEGFLTAATSRALFAIAVPEGAAAAEASRQAHKWFSEVGAHGYLEAYRDAWRTRLPETLPA